MRLTQSRFCKMGKKSFLIFAPLAMVFGCYLERPKERVTSPGSSAEQRGPHYTKPDTKTGTIGQCRVSSDTGCFVGALPPAPGITVGSSHFFDADDLNVRLLDEVIKIDAEQGQDLDGQKANGDEVEVTKPRLLTRIDVKNYTKGFRIFFSGLPAVTTAEPISGGFVVHELPPGDYAIRVQKALRFEVSKKVTSKPAADAPDAEKPVVSINTVSRCLTIFHDGNIEIAAGEKTQMVFNEFDVQYVDSECAGDDASGAVVKL